MAAMNQAAQGLPDEATQRNILRMEQANPLPFKPDDMPTLVSFTTWWHRALRTFPAYFIPPALYVLVLVRLLLANQYFSEVFDNTNGGVPAVMALDLNALYQRCLVLFDVQVESTHTLALLLTHKCASMSSAHVKKYVDEFFKLTTMCASLLGQAIPEDLLRVLLIMGCPAKLRKALLKNPAVRNLDQTKNQILITSGPMAQNLQLTNPPPRNEPMELDMAATRHPRQRGRLSPTERQRRLENGECLYCSAKDHAVANCPLIKAKETQPSRARLNHVEEAAASGNE